METSTADPVELTGHAAAAERVRPADRASRRVSRAGAVLGLLGLSSFALVFVRLFEDWRVSPSASHHVSIFGQSLSYPAANAAAVIIVLLAGLGAIVTAIALVEIVRQVRAANAVRRRLAGLGPSLRDGVWVIDDEHPGAFCAGLLKPRVYVTTRALAILEGPALNAVLLHERHHAHRRDPLRLAVARVIARSLFFLPALGDLHEGQHLLAELGADEQALRGAAGDRSPLAQAMLRLIDASEPGDSTGVDPARIDALLGEPPTWRFPTFLCLMAAVLIAVIVMTAILVGREAAGSATLAPPFLSLQPCILVLGLVPGAIAVAVTLMVRRLRARSAARR